MKDDDDDDYVNAGTKDGFGKNSVTLLPVVVWRLLYLYRLMATGWTAKVHLRELVGVARSILKEWYLFLFSVLIFNIYILYTLIRTTFIGTNLLGFIVSSDTENTSSVQSVVLNKKKKIICVYYICLFKQADHFVCLITCKGMTTKMGISL